MLRTLLACAGTAVVVLAITASGVFAAHTTRGSLYVPACPHSSYGADGTMEPLFCVIDNPAALNYYASAGRHTLALGPNAPPGRGRQGAYRRPATSRDPPILCSVYRLASWREHWKFGVSPARTVGAQLHFYSGPRTDPAFPAGRRLGPSRCGGESGGACSDDA